MKSRKIIVGILAVGMMAFGGGYALGERAEDTNVTQSAFMQACAIGGEGDKKIIQDTLERAATDPIPLKAVTRSMMEWDTLAKPSNTSYQVVTMLQNQKLIQQNERIISLLEAQAKKK